MNLGNRATRRSKAVAAVGCIALAAALHGCASEDGRSPAGGGASGNGAAGAAAAQASGGSTQFGNPEMPGPTRPTGPRPDGGLDLGGCGHLEVRNLDLLFMVDNSRSMREEQAALQREFPKMITVLTTGSRSDGQQVPPIAALHLAVVSSDLGLVGINDIDMCQGLGDEALMQNAPNPAMNPMITGCAASYPRFLTFQAGTDDPVKTANDFSCIASLGTDGCGLEQQLESTLKALWPSTDDSLTFLGDVGGLGTKGQGDGENAGFLRPPSGADTSLLAIVLVTDEDDCSSTTTAHFTPPQYLMPDDPLLQQGFNTRCHFNQQNLFEVDRYVKAFHALRPNGENLVVFGAIVGVPPQLVEPRDFDSVDFENPAAVDAFYQGLLAAPEMQETVDDKGTPEPMDDDLVPSCNTATGKAFPPRRIVQVAQKFGKNSIVQSICQQDFGPAVDAIVDAITRAAKSACIVQ